jgi:hypothetical protein
MFGKHLSYKGIASLCVSTRGDRVAWIDGYDNIKTTIPTQLFCVALYFSLL